MKPNPLIELSAQGQSVWLDFISRDILPAELQQYIEVDGLKGVTSNPSLFEAAISRSPAYRDEIDELTRSGASAVTIYETLAVADVRLAAQILCPVHDQSRGEDGFVSLECAPELAYDAQGTLVEAERLYEMVGEPNVMIKIPGTASAVPAIEEAVYRGIPINVTLLFGIASYRAVAEGYLRGLERRLSKGKSPRVASVASFFVSRVDTEVDARLDRFVGNTPDSGARVASLRGKAAIANAQLGYKTFLEVFNSGRFAKLADRGAMLQRPLWASTSMKNPAYPELLYVEKLIGPHTVNTMPPKTLNAFRERGAAERTIDTDFVAAQAVIDEIEGLGVSMHEVAGKLEHEGVRQFAQAFKQLLDTIERRRHGLYEVER